MIEERIVQPCGIIRLLFSREKHILVIPVTVCKIDNETKERLNGYTGNIYGKFVFQGVYIYNVDLDNVLCGINHGFYILSGNIPEMRIGCQKRGIGKSIMSI